jgi:hypothetical protein
MICTASERVWVLGSCCVIPDTWMATVLLNILIRMW